MPIAADHIRSLIAFGREQEGVEFKSAGPRSDSLLLARVIRAMLAMANRRDGGTIIVGVTEDDTQLKLDGLSADDARSWKHDDLANSVAEYADPRVGFNSYQVAVEGHTLLVIEVEEFAEVPVVCRRTYQNGRTIILRNGAIYVRSHRKPESREASNYDEMRTLLEIATDKAVRRFIARARAAGLDIVGTDGTQAAAAFRAERGDL